MGKKRVTRPKMAGLYGAPPFTVLDARQGYWQERKRLWKSLGFEANAGRRPDMGTMAHYSEGTASKLKKKLCILGGNTTSQFDPLLAEIVYRWFSPPGGIVLDPFAGGPVRGLIAAMTGRRYRGVDLRPEQVEANKVQLNNLPVEIPKILRPQWKVGDGVNIDGLFKGVAVDLIFTCPPYGNLEKYSDDPKDLSNMHYVDFVKAYRKAISASVSLLREDRFICFVVGNFRDAKGRLRNFVGQTISAMKSAGADFYNDGVLVTQPGTLPLRAGSAFLKSRKLGRCHQFVLVFVKGSPKRATEAIGQPLLEEIPDAG